MSRFAHATTVPVERTRAEIERVLTNYKATSFASGWSEAGAAVMFEYKGKRIRFVLPMPDRNDKAIRLRPGSSWIVRTSKQQDEAYDQACRQRWRALLLSIKAKVEAVESNISTFEQEFLAFVVLPSGRTVGDEVLGQIEESYRTGIMPPLLGPAS